MLDKLKTPGYHKWLQQKENMEGGGSNLETLTTQSVMKYVHLEELEEIN